MIISDEATQRAVARLSTNPDFVTFMQWLEDERVAGNTELLNTLNTALVHQLQGSTRLLVDIKQAVTSAPFAVAQRSRQT